MFTLPDNWLTMRQGNAPLVISLPHTGHDLPPELAARVVSPWLARKDCDWWIDDLYAFAAKLDATIIHTSLSRTLVDVNRDPSGVSLYPGQATTELCPSTTFDGEPLYQPGQVPDAAESALRRKLAFDPYHAALAGELQRLRGRNTRVVLYDCHSIRSVIPRLFEGELPQFNIGTHSGAACDARLAAEIEKLCDQSGRSRVTNGRFKGGYITRNYGKPETGIHAVQMELACRGYMREPMPDVSEANWPGAYDPAYAAPIRATLQSVLQACLAFAKGA
ncbi:MAG: N-formylglutamate deformylase [Methylobacterium sp.]|jgi:formiminoglutamase|nr:N-formylglutamate deformylase [Methylobacterium sp.]